MITRDLWTAVGQLRYFAGSHLFTLRAVVPYLLYYVLLPWLLRFALLSLPYGGYLIATAGNKDYLWTNSWEYWAIGALKIVTPVLMQQIWAFHTLY